MNKILRLAPSVSVLVFFASQLGGCLLGDESAAPTACATNAECVAGQACTNGTCVGTQTSSAGAAGSPNGSAGSASGGSAVNSAGGNVNGAGSGNVAAGNGGMAGLGSAGYAGTQTNAGSSSGGSGSAGSGSGGMSGAGMGGSGNPITIGQCKDDYWPAANNGSVTRYDFKQGTSLPACAYAITHTGGGSDGDWDTVEGISTGDGGYFGAMNTTDFNQGAACGACVEAGYNGKKVVLTIVDECPIGSNPVCTKGHIDLSRKAIRQLEPNGSLENLKGVSWRYVKCPASGNVKARLHPNQNADWQPVVIENGLYPIKSVTLNGANATRTGNSSGGNAWIASPQKPPYTVKATDVNNNAITFSYSGGSGLKDVGLQFMCQ
jgi:expansin (peptidoglycan-binding protein)